MNKINILTPKQYKIAQKIYKKQIQAKKSANTKNSRIGENI